MGKYRKAIAGLISGGGAAAILTAFGVSLEVITPVVALATALMVYWVPNSE